MTVPKRSPLGSAAGSFTCSRATRSHASKEVWKPALISGWFFVRRNLCFCVWHLENRVLAAEEKQTAKVIYYVSRWRAGPWIVASACSGQLRTCDSRLGLFFELARQVGYLDSGGSCNCLCDLPGNWTIHSYCEPPGGDGSWSNCVLVVTGAQRKSIS